MAIDFKALKEKQDALRKAYIPLQKESPPAQEKGHSSEYYLDVVIDLLDYNITQWEVGFCNSVKRHLMSSTTASLSQKQIVVLDKLAKEHLSPTPKGNPPPQIAKPSVSRDAPKKGYFDDMDDDIPF